MDNIGDNQPGMASRLWLLFAQTVTIALAVGLAIAALAPDFWGRRVAVQVADSAPAATRPDSYGEAIARVLPAVVSVYGREIGGHPTEAASPPPSSNLGSGVIVAADGYILTNHHVVAEAAAIEIALHSRGAPRPAVYPATIVGANPKLDIAVLKIKADNLPIAVFSKEDNLRVGDVVIAIGSPFGLSQTVTMGIVSAVGRTRLGLARFEDFIQTDAAINPGNSGGALADASGRVVGINSALYSKQQGFFAQGIGFAIPAGVARDAFARIIEGEKE
jgi:serine protease DegQ